MSYAEKSEATTDGRLQQKLSEDIRIGIATVRRATEAARLFHGKI